MSTRRRVAYVSPARLDRLADLQAACPCEAAATRETAQLVAAAVRTLPQRWRREWIALFYGLDGRLMLDETEIGRAWRTSPERVRGILAHARDRLWHRLRRRE